MFTRVVRRGAAVHHRCAGLVSLFVVSGVIAFLPGCGGNEPDAKTEASIKALQDQVSKSAGDVRSAVDTLAPGIEANRKAVSEASERMAAAMSSVSKDVAAQFETRSARLTEVSETLQRTAQAFGPTAAAAQKSINDAAAQILDVAGKMDAEATSMRAMGTTVAEAVSKLDAAVTGLSDRDARRAKQSADLAEKASTSGRLREAVILMTSAAMADSSNPAYATRLAELVLGDPSATPESLGAAATTLRALAMQCSGEAVTVVWRSADALDAKAASMIEASSKQEAEAAVRAAEVARADACRQLEGVARENFVAATSIRRAELIQQLTDAIDEAGEQCPAAVDAALSVLTVWQRIIRFDDAIRQVDSALMSIDAELRAGRGAGTAASAVLASAEGSLRTLWATSPSDVGNQRWERAIALQDRFASVTEQLLDARDEPTRVKIQKNVNDVLAKARETKSRYGDLAPARQGAYATQITRVQEAMMTLAADSAKLMGAKARAEAGKQQADLQAAIRELSEAQFKSYCVHVARQLRVQIDLADAEKEVSVADAVRFAEALYDIDPASLPGPLAEAFAYFWQYLVSECDDDAKWKITKGRMDAPSKLSAGAF